ncbi:hypothetical protein [Cystobacter fuscus]|uniref:hypothetical protein n=1 Tax=Cystobacter fuscus TaxID=43 RepID=UPI0037C16E20
MRASACAVLSEYGDSSSAFTRQHGRYDADSRLLEMRSFKKDGTLFSVETHRWVQGHEVLRRIEHADYWTQREWSYDAQGRLLRIEKSSADDPTVLYRYAYDAAGRLDHIERSGDSRPGTTFYRYDEAGRVLSIDGEDSCEREFAVCGTYTYRSNGQPREIKRWDSHYWGMDEDYDESGRLSSREWSGYDVMGNDSYTYDAAGRLSRYWLKEGLYTFGREAIRTSLYDAQGLLQLQRYAEDNVRHDPSWDPEQDVHGYIRTTRRVSYFCGTDIVALDEWDSDEDGVVDARRTHERDVMGRLVRELYSGTPRLDEGPVRRDFIYECD